MCRGIIRNIDEASMDPLLRRTITLDDAVQNKTYGEIIATVRLLARESHSLIALPSTTIAGTPMNNENIPVFSDLQNDSYRSFASFSSIRRV
ncbi:MAG: hypothetical protein KGI67_01745 [Pseudomonadota bacterium]|nr:hypothetical protein [Pseudomonadota bacterium]